MLDGTARFAGRKVVFDVVSLMSTAASNRAISAGGGAMAGSDIIATSRGRDLLATRLPPGSRSRSVLDDEVGEGKWQVDPPAKAEVGFVLPIGKGFSGSLACDAVDEKAIGIVAVKRATRRTSSRSRSLA